MRGFASENPLFTFLLFTVTTTGMWLVLGAEDIALLLFFPAWLLAYIGMLAAATGVVLRARRRADDSH